MKTIFGRVKGITFRYAKNNIGSYKTGDYLKLEHEPFNSFDKNAIAVYDKYLNHIGYISRDINSSILQIINVKKYYCEITQVYYSSNTPSIEYRICYQNDDESDYSFDIKFNEYCDLFSIINHQDKFDDVFDDLDDVFDDVEIKEHSLMSPDIDDYKELCENAWEAYNNALYERSYYSFWQLAVLNFGFAQFFTAYLLFYGKEIAQDYEASFMWFKRALKNGNQSSLYFIGYFYEHGIIVKKNIEKAISYYERAIENGSYGALSRMSAIYFYGTGVEQDLIKCNELYKKSLEMIKKSQEEDSEEND